MQTAGTQQEEHRRSVRRSDDRADQQAGRPAEAKQEMGGGTGNERGDDNAQRCQQARRRQRTTETGHLGAQTAIEQDYRQRQRTEEIGQPVVVEADTKTVLAEAHADQQEHQQQGRAKARRDQAGGDAHQDQKRAAEQQPVAEVQLFHAVFDAVPSERRWT